MDAMKWRNIIAQRFQRAPRRFAASAAAVQLLRECRLDLFVPFNALLRHWAHPRRAHIRLRKGLWLPTSHNSLPTRSGTKDWRSKGPQPTAFRESASKQLKLTSDQMQLNREEVRAQTFLNVIPYGREIKFSENMDTVRALNGKPFEKLDKKDLESILAASCATASGSESTSIFMRPF